ncbi:MAG: hypothetical protein E7652_03925 [Ruminococcaceae bacterium]|nr:hypothetical protein [Oscillospiraceae bacterium]
MKKRLLSIIIALVLVLPTLLFAGCKKKDNVVVLKGSDATPITVTLYSIVNGDKVNEKVRSALENKINEITEFEFNTHVVLKLFTEEEYHENLYTNLEKAISSQTQQTGVVSNVKDTKKPELATDENGDTKYVEVRKEDIQYPELKENQVDIFLVNSVGQYNTHINKGQLKDLSAQVLPGAGSALLTKYINSTLMEAMTRSSAENKLLYAIPNNRVIGEYEYMLVNKDLAEKEVVDSYFVNDKGEDAFDAETVEAFLQGVSLIDNVLPLVPDNFATDTEATEGEGSEDAELPENNEEENKEEVKEENSSSIDPSKYTLIYDTYGVKPLVETLEGDYYGAYVGDGKLKLGVYPELIPGSLLNSTGGEFAREAAIISEYSSTEIAEGTEPACMFVKGTAGVLDEYKDDYYVYTYRKPVARNENVYNSMYAVASHLDDSRTVRCMEIITYMQTNKEFANILRYGVEGVHYEKDEETDMVSVLKTSKDVAYTDYLIKPEYAGNMFLHYQNTDMTEVELALSDDNWAAAKDQNLKDTVYSPYLGFDPATVLINIWTLKGYSDKEQGEYTTEEILGRIAELSDEAAAELEGLKGVELKDKMEALGTQMVSEDAHFAQAVNNGVKNSPQTLYYQWSENNKPKEDK